MIALRPTLFLCCFLPGMVAAEPTRAVFDIYVSGLRAGVVSVAGEEEGGRYAASGRLESVGLIGAVRSVRYDGEVTGRLDGTMFAPQEYAETYRRGQHHSRRSIVYRGGVPQVRPADGKGRLDPREQAGTIDPLTAIWGVLRDVREDEACRFSGDVFDGKRRSRVTLGGREKGGGRITCAGEYRRVAGYDSDEMENPVFPFLISYRAVGDGTWQVERIVMESIFGKGAIVRR